MTTKRSHRIGSTGWWRHARHRWPAALDHFGCPGVSDSARFPGPHCSVRSSCRHNMPSLHRMARRRPLRARCIHLRQRSHDVVAVQSRSWRAQEVGTLRRVFLTSGVTAHWKYWIWVTRSRWCSSNANASLT
ncbi:hypothetical protein H257_09240 [Aphanomyces astaci]|uniref:Uncharacterized protein n=1 Tax=Aphanomyces astaci TaxID=112090 RepID=W4GAS1_APHAT|nr:hypothetical protein H257_09240 [Aphanomyces astaci]ETV76787.1 hypothetical protein H257_09240 [Aphanomyces astaci]|eukprot:XP_009833699.1 hypothetical protein H257_09240 [Aphanomyces astaci]